VLTVKVVAATVSVTCVAGVVDAEMLPKSNVAVLVPVPPSVTPLASVMNVKLIEPIRLAMTTRVPELVCPCAEAKPGIRNKLVNNPANKIALFFILTRLSR
jgi:hypothetical protein